MYRRNTCIEITHVLTYHRYRPTCNACIDVKDVSTLHVYQRNMCIDVTHVSTQHMYRRNTCIQFTLHMYYKIKHASNVHICQFYTFVSCMYIHMNLLQHVSIIHKNASTLRIYWLYLNIKFTKFVKSACLSSVHVSESNLICIEYRVFTCSIYDIYTCMIKCTCTHVHIDSAHV